MAKRRKSRSWRDKLEDPKDLPKVIEIPEKMKKKLGEGTMVIPTPKEVDEIMRSVPRGKLITINRIREKLAKKHDTTTSCPITTGIFAWIAAHAAKEAEESVEKDVTPYWRTLKAGGVINEKYPGGVEEIKKLLEKEGFEVIKKGKRYIVKDYERFMVD
jgi:hypothetical protein